MGVLDSLFRNPSLAASLTLLEGANRDTSTPLGLLQAMQSANNQTAFNTRQTNADQLSRLGALREQGAKTALRQNAAIEAARIKATNRPEITPTQQVTSGFEFATADPNAENFGELPTQSLLGQSLVESNPVQAVNALLAAGDVQGANSVLKLVNATKSTGGGTSEFERLAAIPKADRTQEINGRIQKFITDSEAQGRPLQARIPGAETPVESRFKDGKFEVKDQSSGQFVEAPQGTQFFNLPSPQGSNEDVGIVNPALRKRITDVGTKREDTLKLRDQLDSLMLRVQSPAVAGGTLGAGIELTESVRAQIGQFLSPDGTINPDKLTKRAIAEGALDSESLMLAALVAKLNNNGRISDKDLEVARQITGEQTASKAVRMELLRGLRRKANREFGRTVQSARGDFPGRNVPAFRDLQDEFAQFSGIPPADLRALAARADELSVKDRDALSRFMRANGIQ